MPSLNKIMLMGNVTRPLELHFLPKGTPVVEVGLAINERYRDGDETKEKVTFVDVVFYGKQAETLCKYVTKGSPLYIEGKLTQEEWADKTTGQKKRKTKVIGREFQFIGGRRDEEAPSQQEPRPAAASAAAPGRLEDEDEIPF